MLRALILTLSLIGSTSLFAKETSLYQFKAKNIQGEDINMSQFKGKVLLIVNTASQCGYTPQLKDLEQLQKKYGKKGFSVMAFPSNDFNQDPGTNKEVAEFAKKEYQVTFPFMDKAAVSGPNKQPIYKFLVESQPGPLFKEVQWNFEKFLIGKDGQVIERWNTKTSPSDKEVIAKIEQALSEKPQQK